MHWQRRSHTIHTHHAAAASLVQHGAQQAFIRQELVLAPRGPQAQPDLLRAAAAAAHVQAQQVAVGGAAAGGQAVTGGCHMYGSSTWPPASMQLVPTLAV